MKGNLEMAICKGCGHYIKFIRTFSGKWIPVEPEEIYYKKDPEGNIIVVNYLGQTMRARAVSWEEKDGIGFIPHWAKCPAADKMRKGRS